MSSYRIRSGDTLFTIAKNNKSTVDAIAKANNITDPNRIYAGQTLTIPDTFTPAPPPKQTGPIDGAPAPGTVPPAAPATGPITTTEQANKVHLTQWGSTPYNTSGTEYGFSDCVPTSGVIALSALGLQAPPAPGEASEAIDQMRDQSLGYDTSYSAPMNFGSLSNGLAQDGAVTQDLAFQNGNLSEIDAALEAGNPVVAAGNPWNAWGAEQDAAGNYLNHQDPGGHAITLLGKTEDGNYIAADPLLSQSTIEVTPAQLNQFFADGGSNSGAMEVSRADGQPAPGLPVDGSAPAPAPAPTTPTPSPLPPAGLERGMYGTDVQRLQDMLVSEGLMTPSQVNSGRGIYGPQTQNAVSQLQDRLISQGVMTAAQKSTGPGTFGPATRAGMTRARAAKSTSEPAPEPSPLDGLSAPAVNLGRGATGGSVQQLQQSLVGLGFMKQSELDSGPGIFGPRTEAAVLAFQKANGVTQTGFYGPASRAAMQGLLPPQRDSGAVPSSSDPAWDNVDRWNDELLHQQQVVYEETGVRVPLDRAKAHMMIESEGITGPSVNNVNGDSLGLFQVTSNSYGRYDRERLAVDPGYQIYAGLKELALRYQDPNNPYGWDGASSAFFSGAYSDLGRADTTNGTTQGQYAQRMQQLMGQLS